jgi:hypothetical protein
MCRMGGGRGVHSRHAEQRARRWGSVRGRGQPLAALVPSATCAVDDSIDIDGGHAADAFGHHPARHCGPASTKSATRPAPPIFACPSPWCTTPPGQVRRPDRRGHHQRQRRPRCRVRGHLDNTVSTKVSGVAPEAGEVGVEANDEGGGLAELRRMHAMSARQEACQRRRIGNRAWLS